MHYHSRNLTRPLNLLHIGPLTVVLLIPFVVIVKINVALPLVTLLTRLGFYDQVEVENSL